MPKVQPIEDGAAAGARGRGASSSSLSEINVVPLVDVMLVLLIIFMVTAPMMQRGIDVNLPLARRAQQIDATSACSSPCRCRSARTTACSVGDDACRSRCSPSACGRRCGGGPTRRCSCGATAALSVQDLMDVMDRLKEAGVEKVGIVAKFPEAR